MWQSRVEIEHYSDAYFDCVTAFEALQRSTSIKGGTHTSCVLGIDAASLHVWAPPLMEVPRYSTSNVVTQSKYTMK